MTYARTSYSRSIPVKQWPEKDQAAWRMALQPADPLDSSIGFASRWKPSTCTVTADGYGHWLTWLTRSGQLDDAGPAQRVSRERIAAYREAMEQAGLAPYTVAGRLQQLGNMLQALAPEHDWIWINKGAARLHSRATPTRDKVDNLRAADDVLQLGLDLMRAAEQDRFRTKVERAVLFRDGLLLAMLVSRPLRRANITNLKIGTQLRRQGDHWWLVFESVEMKSKRRFECSLPEELTPMLDHYIAVHRPVLAECTRKGLDPSDALWMSKQGTPMTAAAVAFQVGARTKEEFGKAINPHAFRRIYATDIATESPAHAGDIRLGLGHATQRTSERFYNMAKMVDAGNKHQTTIAELRKGARGKRDDQWREAE